MFFLGCLAGLKNGRTQARRSSAIIALAHLLSVTPLSRPEQSALLEDNKVAAVAVEGASAGKAGGSGTDTDPETVPLHGIVCHGIVVVPGKQEAKGNGEKSGSCVTDALGLPVTTLEV